MDGDTFDRLELYPLFVRAVPHFQYYYVTEITLPDFERLEALAPEHGPAAAAFVAELAVWVRPWLDSDGVFTICGI